MTDEMNENTTPELSPEEAQALAEKKARFDACAEAVRDKAKQEKYLSMTELCATLEMEKDKTAAMLAEMQAEEDYKDICSYQGEKDLYWYTYPTLAHNYVKNLVLADEDDLAHTIADVVRYESKTYPRATAIDTFSKFPYHYTRIQVQRMLEKMAKLEQYTDIQSYVSNAKNQYLFSTKHLTPRYAATLVEMSEDKRLWM